MFGSRLQALTPFLKSATFISQGSFPRQ
jgi:hypothetical protein